MCDRKQGAWCERRFVVLRDEATDRAEKPGIAAVFPPSELRADQSITWNLVTSPPGHPKLAAWRLGLLLELTDELTLKGKKLDLESRTQSAVKVEVQLYVYG